MYLFKHRFSADVAHQIYEPSTLRLPGLRQSGRPHLSLLSTPDIHISTKIYLCSACFHTDSFLVYPQ